MSIGTDMVKYRQNMNMTQQACSKSCGISLQTWCSVENERQKPSKLTEGKIRKLIGFNEDKSYEEDHK